MKRVAIYIRVSTLEQNPELQISELQQQVKSQGWELFQVFEDRLSGANTKRPQFQEMNRLARLNKFDILIVWKLDRAFRSTSDAIIQIQEYSDLGVKFVSLKDPGLDMTTPTGRLLMHLLAAFAEFEHSIIKMRVRSGIANAKLKGKRLGRPPSINLERAVELRQQGKSLSEIAKELKTTKSGVSKTLSKYQLTKTLNNTNITQLSNSTAEVEKTNIYSTGESVQSIAQQEARVSQLLKENSNL